jgi:hypothetical protein
MNFELREPTYEEAVIVQEKINDTPYEFLFEDGEPVAVILKYGHEKAKAAVESIVANYKATA